MPLLLIALFPITFPVWLILALFLNERRQLRNPHLNKVPLPKVDDKRWTFHDTYYECGSFRAWKTGHVTFKYTTLGYWTRYYVFVERAHRRPRYDEVALEAAEELKVTK